MHEQRVIEKRRQAQRLRVAMGGLNLATAWLRHLVDGGPEPDAPLFDVFDAWDTARSPGRLLELPDALSTGDRSRSLPASASSAAPQEGQQT